MTCIRWHPTGSRLENSRSIIVVVKMRFNQNEKEKYSQNVQGFECEKNLEIIVQR